jgi:capsular polysaccharide biosynthesis protein
LGALAAPEEAGDAVAVSKVASLAPDPQAEHQALVEALTLLDGGSMSEAAALLEPFANRASHVRTLTTLSRIRLAEGAFAEALRLLKVAEKLDPMDPKVWRLLADNHATQRQHTEEVHYRRKVALADRAAPALAFYGWVRAILRATPKGAVPRASELQLAAQKFDSSESTDAERIQFAEVIYAVSLHDMARKRYSSVSPLLPHQRDTSASWMRMVDWCKRSGTPMTRLVDAGAPMHRPTVAECSDAWIFPRFQWIPVVDEGRVAFSDFVMHRVQTRSEDPRTPLLMNSPKLAELRVPTAMRVVDRPALLIGGMAQYYHDTIDFLGTLAIADTAGKAAGLPLVVNDELAPFQREQLGLLGYRDDELIRVKAEEGVRFERLVVSTRAVRGGRWIDPILPRWFRSRLLPNGKALQGFRKLYVSRKGTARRRVENEGVFYEFLAREGYELVQPELLSVRQQIDLFAEATHVVGPSGAALTNIIYAAPGCAVLVLISRNLIQGGGDLYFDALAEACGHRFATLECLPSRIAQGHRAIDADLVVDQQAARAALAHLDSTTAVEPSPSPRPDQTTEDEGPGQ